MVYGLPTLVNPSPRPPAAFGEGAMRSTA